MPFPAEDNLVQHGNAESFAGLLELPGEQNVLSAWSKVTGGMIVGKDNRRGSVGYGIGKNFARVDLGFID